MSREHETQTPLYRTRVSDVQPAVVPSDGGRYVIYCDHFDARTGEWCNAGLLQDNDKRRLAQWIPAKRGAGFTEWCEECQVAHEHHARAGA
jgi:Zn-finger protein